MYRLGLVDTLVTHANMKEFCLVSLSTECRGYMPPQLKTKDYKPFDSHCPLTHLQSPLHQLAPFPFGHSAHVVALWFPQLTKKTDLINFLSS